jgi:hypothetical protein
MMVTHHIELNSQDARHNIIETLSLGDIKKNTELLHMLMVSCCKDRNCDCVILELMIFA